MVGELSCFFCAELLLPVLSKGEHVTFTNPDRKLKKSNVASKRVALEKKTGGKLCNPFETPAGAV